MEDSTMTPTWWTIAILIWIISGMAVIIFILIVSVYSHRKHEEYQKYQLDYWKHRSRYYEGLDIELLVTDATPIYEKRIIPKFDMDFKEQAGWNDWKFWKKNKDLQIV